MVDSSALVGSAVVGQARVGSLGATAPEYFRSGGSWWKLIHDPQIGITEQQIRDWAAQDAQDKAEAAQEEAVRLAGVAAAEADEALEAALGDMVADKSNVFIQDVAPVAEMQRPGVLWIDTTPVTVDGQLVPGNTPRTWDDAAAQWVAIMDAAVVQASAEAAAAHQAAQDAADAASEAMAEARYAPRTAGRPPVQADGVDKPVGAAWHEYAETTNYEGITADRLVQTWMWTGSVWVRLDMDPEIIPVIQIGTGTFGDLSGDRIHVTELLSASLAEIIELSVEHLVVTEGATINEAVAIAISGATLDYQEAYLHNLRVDELATIDEAVIGKLAAQLITSGLFRTAEAGQRVVIDETGLVMYGLDPDGIEFEMVRIGPSGDNLITLGETTMASDGVQSPSGTFDSLSVGGDDLATILARQPRGVISFMFSPTASAWHGQNTDVRRIEAEATLEPGRRYRITVDQYNLELRSASPMNYVTRLKSTIGGIDSDLASIRHHLVGTTANQPIPPMMGYVETSGLTGPTDALFGYIVRGEGNRDHRISSTASNLRITVEDIGPAIVSTGNSYMDEGTAAEGSTDAPPKQEPKKRYTKTYDATGGYRVYDNNGNQTSDPDVVQGLYAGGPSRLNRRGGWLHPTMTGDLAGATIESIRVKIHVNHTYYHAGSTVNVATWSDTIRDGLTVRRTVTGWKKGTSKWLTLPASTHAGFKSGAIRGIGVLPTSSSATQYTRFATNSKIEITYVK